MGYHAQTHAVFGMLADKDIDGVVAALRGQVDRWTVAPLPGPRGASAQRLADALARAGVRAGGGARRAGRRERVAGGGRRGGRG